jgi:hypothetical protein
MEVSRLEITQPLTETNYMAKLRATLITFLLLTLLTLGIETWSDIGLGAVAQWGSHNYDALLVLPPSYPPRQRLAAFIEEKQSNLAFQVGRAIGATAAMLQGAVEIADGGRRVQVGLLACAESMGVGCGVGGAVAVSGVVEGVHGAVVIGQGFVGWRESSGQVLRIAAKGGESRNNSASEIKWKGFSKGKLSEHYNKHVVSQGEFGNITQNDYLQQAKSFASEINSQFKEKVVGDIIIKYDPATGRLLVGNVAAREIRTFYIDDGRFSDPFQAAINEAQNLTGR